MTVHSRTEYALLTDWFGLGEDALVAMDNPSLGKAYLIEDMLFVARYMADNWIGKHGAETSVDVFRGVMNSCLKYYPTRRDAVAACAVIKNSRLMWGTMENIGQQKSSYDSFDAAICLAKFDLGSFDKRVGGCLTFIDAMNACDPNSLTMNELMFLPSSRPFRLSIRLRAVLDVTKRPSIVSYVNSNLGYDDIVFAINHDIDPEMMKAAVNQIA